MKPCINRLAVFLAALCWAVPFAGAQDTLAVSRLVTAYLPEPPSTRAVSRLVVTHLSPTPDGTRTQSRAVTAYISPDADVGNVGTTAISRQATAWLGYSMPNAIAALRIAAGLQTASARERELYDLIRTGAPPDLVDLLDAVRVLVYSQHPEWLP